LGDNAGLMSARFRPFRSTLSTLLTLAALSALACVMVLAAGTARAQDKPVDPKVAAKEHYTRGTSFYDLGRYDEAIKEFEAAYQLKNDPAFLYNLAQSYRQAGNHDQAVHFYKTYLRYVPSAPNRADIEEKIKTEEQLAAQKGPGTTPPPANTTAPPPPNTPPPPPNTMPPTGNEPTVAVPPGSSPPPADYAPPPGGAPPPSTYPASTVTTSDPGRKFRIAGGATAGAGAIMMVLGIVEWRRAVSASKDVEQAALNGDSFDPDVEKRGHSAETLQWVFYGVGALAAAGGVGLWLYGQKLTAAAETTTWRVSLAPTLAPNQGGATLRIVF
jgi:tetratricopeptide (TPR) repeat protein